nr:ribosome maturation factor RimM [Atribacter laminatus]
MAVGKFIKPHGLAGGLKALPFGETLDSFSPGKTLFIEDKDQYRALVVKNFQPMGRFVLLWLIDLSTKEEVEWLSGQLIWREKTKVTRPDNPDTYLVYQLIDLKIMENGQFCGIVSDVVEGSAYDYLQVNRENREFLIPFIRVYVKHIDLQGGYITVECPVGFWE